MKQRIHIFGASGSGTTTIAKLVCKELAYAHFDSDNYFWQPTEDPFTVERSKGECLSLMGKDLSDNYNWVLSGSIVSWGNTLIPYFDLVVFVYVPQSIRIERLKNREFQRYGSASLEGGAKHEKCKAFLEWAALYDSGTAVGRSLQKHEAWLTQINCDTLKLVNNSLEDSVTAVLKAIQNN